MKKIYQKNHTLFLLLTFGFGSVFAQAPVMNSIQGPQAVCSTPASPMSFTASASNSPTSYSWTVVGPPGATINNPTSSVTSVSFPYPYSNVTYTLYCIAMNGFGTSAPVSFVVNIFETPTVTFSGATSFCQGSSTNLSASPTIVSASSTLFYNWSPATGLNTTSGPVVTANPPFTTTYTVLLTLGSCTNTQLVTVTVNPLPSVSVLSNPGTICNGENAYLTIGGSAVSFSLNGIAAAGTISVNPSSSATYTVEGVDANGCKNTSTTLLTVNPLPSVSVASNPGTICKGEKADLTFSGSAVSFSLNGVTAAGTISVNPTSSTTYTVLGVDANGCENSSTILVTVNPLPSVSVVSNPGTICKGEKANLTISGSAVSFSLNGVTTADTISVNPTNSTTYTVVGIDANGCKDTSTTALTVNPCLGINSVAIEESLFEVYPNPNNGSFVLRSARDEKITITNELGQTIKTFDLASNSETQISGLPGGIYFVVTPRSRYKIIVIE